MKTPRGFTLVEVAIVMVIVGLLLGGLVSAFGTLQQQQKIGEATTKLNDVRDALLGFAAVNGRLPCPASTTSNGYESFCTNATGACGPAVVVPPGVAQPHGRCSAPFNGYLPAATLGLQGASGGYLIDGLGPDPVNRIRYAVADNTAPLNNNGACSPASPSYRLITGTCNEVKTDSTNWTPSATNLLLRVCQDAGCAVQHVNNAVAVLVAPGKNGAGTGTDEAENYDGDNLFVSHSPTETGAPAGEFDDIVTWIAPSTLLNRLYQAGRLP